MFDKHRTERPTKVMRPLTAGMRNLSACGVLIFASCFLTSFLNGSDAQAQSSAPDPLPKAAPATSNSPEATPARTEETPATIMDGQQVQSILGRKVRGAGADDIGRIVDIVADKAGVIRAAIIDFGGFLGVGSRQIAVDWRAVRFPPDADAVSVDLSRDQLRVAPIYKAGEQIVVIGQRKDAAAPQPASLPAASDPARKDASPK